MTSFMSNPLVSNSSRLEKYMSDQREQRPITTNDAGIPASSDEYSLTVVPDGPVLLQDSYLIQKMAQFNPERIPERAAHATGGTTCPYFEMTLHAHPLS